MIFPIGISATLNGTPIVNHDLVYFDEIGFDPATGLICSGLASGICCEDYDPVSSGGIEGSEPNGIGSWVYPNGSYVRRNCTGCSNVESDPFQIFRTVNTTILYRNDPNNLPMAGIYRCKTPLNTSFEGVVDNALIQFVGIYKRFKGKNKNYLEYYIFLFSFYVF